MIKNKRYDLNFIDDLLSLYDYKVGLRTYGIIVTPCGPNQFYQPEIMCLTNDDKYEEGGNFYINRFSMGFSGFGNCEKEKEDMIYNNIVKAKQLIDILNKYVDKCNKKYEKSEVIPSPPEVPNLRIHKGKIIEALKCCDKNIIEINCYPNCPLYEDCNDCYCQAIQSAIDFIKQNIGEN